MSKLVNKGIVKAAEFMNMKNRINYFKVAPDALEKVMGLDRYVGKSVIDKKLAELIKLRVSQINGCCYCINMHTKAAKKLKVTNNQLQQLKNWNESDMYSPKEKVAMHLAENMTLISEKGVSDELYEQVREHYNEKEYVDLVMIINMINMWNRLSISMGNHASE